MTHSVEMVGEMQVSEGIIVTCIRVGEIDHGRELKGEERLNSDYPKNVELQ